MSLFKTLPHVDELSDANGIDDSGEGHFTEMHIQTLTRKKHETFWNCIHIAYQCILWTFYHNDDAYAQEFSQDTEFIRKSVRLIEITKQNTDDDLSEPVDPVEILMGSYDKFSVADEVINFFESYFQYTGKLGIYFSLEESGLNLLISNPKEDQILSINRIMASYLGDWELFPEDLDKHAEIDTKLTYPPLLDQTYYMLSSESWKQNRINEVNVGKSDILMKANIDLILKSYSKVTHSKIIQNMRYLHMHDFIDLQNVITNFGSFQLFFDLLRLDSGNGDISSVSRSYTRSFGSGMQLMEVAGSMVDSDNNSTGVNSRNVSNSNSRRSSGTSLTGGVNISNANANTNTSYISRLQKNYLELKQRIHLCLELKEMRNKTEAAFILTALSSGKNKKRVAEKIKKFGFIDEPLRNLLQQVLCSSEFSRVDDNGNIITRSSENNILDYSSRRESEGFGHFNLNSLVINNVGDDSRGTDSSTVQGSSSMTVSQTSSADPTLVNNINRQRSTEDVQGQGDTEDGNNTNNNNNETTPEDEDEHLLALKESYRHDFKLFEEQLLRLIHALCDHHSNKYWLFSEFDIEKLINVCKAYNREPDKNLTLRWNEIQEERRIRKENKLKMGFTEEDILQEMTEMRQQQRFLAKMIGIHKSKHKDFQQKLTFWLDRALEGLVRPHAPYIGVWLVILLTNLSFFYLYFFYCF